MSETTNHEIQIRLPFEMLAAILNQLDEMELRAVQRYVEECLVKVHESEKERRLEESKEDWLDEEFLEYAMQEADNTVSLQEVRKALSKIPGSLAADVIASREER